MTKHFRACDLSWSFVIEAITVPKNPEKLGANLLSPTCADFWALCPTGSCLLVPRLADVHCCAMPRPDFEPGSSALQAVALPFELSRRWGLYGNRTRDTRTTTWCDGHFTNSPIA